jgi:hypothetical protein
MSSSSAPQVSETALQGEQAQVAQAQFLDYMNNYKPLMDKYIAQETDPTVKTTREKQVAGEINADIMQKIDPSKMSANPVKNTKMLSGLEGLETKSQVSGQGASRGKELTSMGNIIAMGRGEQATATQGIGQLASMSVSDAIKTTELEQESTAADENMIGSVAGMVTAGALKYGMGSGNKKVTYDGNEE